MSTAPFNSNLSATVTRKGQKMSRELLSHGHTHIL